MKHSIKVGLSFGMTSGIITTLGLIVGLAEGTQSAMLVIGGILTIAVADSLSDALGIHVSEESEGVHTNKQVWVSTISTFVTKFLVACTFIIPFLLLDLQKAVGTSVVWGFILLNISSFFIARQNPKMGFNPIAEHSAIALIVIIITYFIGKWISGVFL